MARTRQHKSANRFLWILIGAIITFIFGLSTLLIASYFNTPKAYLTVDERCNSIVQFNDPTRFNPVIKNKGDAPAFVKECLSSNKFLIGDNLNHIKVCSDWMDLHQQTIVAPWIATVGLDVIPDKNIIDKIMNGTVNIEILCKQNIWFLERECKANTYSCIYKKGMYKFELV